MRYRPLARMTGILAALVMLIGGLAAASKPVPDAIADSPLLVSARPGPVPLPTTTVVPPPPTSITLPEPVATPEEDYYEEPVVVIGRLAIPRLGLDVELHQGLSLHSIDRGPSHWPGTAMPGELGNVVVAGHRVTRTRPFRHLDTLRPGDQAIFTMPGGAYTYEFVAHEIVTPDRVDIATQQAAYTATFFACHPPGSARQRIVAYWRLVSAPAPGSPHPATLAPVQFPLPPPP